MRLPPAVAWALGLVWLLSLLTPGSLTGDRPAAAATPDAPPPEAGGPACVRCHRPGEAHPKADYTQAPDCIACHLGILQPKVTSRSPGPTLRLAKAVGTLPAGAGRGKPQRPPGPNAEGSRPERRGGVTAGDPEQGGTRVEAVTEMVFVPPGPFLMGNNGRENVSEGPGDLDERPRRLVYVDGFSIDLHEVSNAQYESFVIATKHRLPWHWKNGKVPKGKIAHPVVYVDWHDAVAYCRWAGKRLPTEAEWEKAARGTDGRAFPWGRQFDPLKANTPQYWLHKGRRVAKGDTMPVGRFEAGRSPYGLYDMAGNVYEWTASWYLPYPGNTVPNIHYGLRNKVVRGGSWYDCLTYGCGLSSPAYNRSRFAPEIRNSNFGFRCATTAAGP